MRRYRRNEALPELPEPGPRRTLAAFDLRLPASFDLDKLFDAWPMPEPDKYAHPVVVTPKAFRGSGCPACGEGFRKGSKAVTPAHVGSWYVHRVCYLAGVPHGLPPISAEEAAKFGKLMPDHLPAGQKYVMPYAPRTNATWRWLGLPAEGGRWGSLNQPLGLMLSADPYPGYTNGHWWLSAVNAPADLEKAIAKSMREEGTAWQPEGDGHKRPDMTRILAPWYGGNPRGRPRRSRAVAPPAPSRKAEAAVYGFEPIARILSDALSRQSTEMVLLSNGGPVIGVSARYFDYLQKSYPGGAITVDMGGKDAGPVAWHFGGRIVALCMPMRHEFPETLTLPLWNYIAQGEVLFNPPVRRQLHLFRNPRALRAVPTPEADTGKPDPGDYVIAPRGSRVSLAVRQGPVVGIFPDATAATRAALGRMNRERYWPDLWIWDAGEFVRQNLHTRAPRRRAEGTNPRPARGGGRGTLIYSDGRIVGKFLGRHAVDGKLYRHQFTHAHVTVTGLPDGSILFTPHTGRLWSVHRV